MDINVFKDLQQQSQLGTLRESSVSLKYSKINLAVKKAIKNALVNLIINQQYDDNLSEYLYYKNSLEKNFNLQGEGIINNPFRLSTNFANGKFYNAHLLFCDGKYPNFIKPNSCHTNSYKFAKMYIDNCSVLFGISSSDYPFLHSVIKIKDFIIDFNYNLVMSKDLYISLFNFEVLNEVFNTDIKANHNRLANKLQENNSKITDAEVNACYYEIINLLNNNKLID